MPTRLLSLSSFRRLLSLSRCHLVLLKGPSIVSSGWITRPFLYAYNFISSTTSPITNQRFRDQRKECRQLLTSRVPLLSTVKSFQHSKFIRSQDFLIQLKPTFRIILGSYQSITFILTERFRNHFKHIHVTC